MYLGKHKIIFFIKSKEDIPILLKYFFSINDFNANIILNTEYSIFYEYEHYQIFFIAHLPVSQYRRCDEIFIDDYYNNSNNFLESLDILFGPLTNLHNNKIKKVYFYNIDKITNI